MGIVRGLGLRNSILSRWIHTSNIYQSKFKWDANHPISDDSVCPVHRIFFPLKPCYLGLTTQHSPLFVARLPPSSAAAWTYVASLIYGASPLLHLFLILFTVYSLLSSSFSLFISFFIFLLQKGTEVCSNILFVGTTENDWTHTHALDWHESDVPLKTLAKTTIAYRSK